MCLDISNIDGCDSDSTSLAKLADGGAPVEACRKFLQQILAGKGELDWRLPLVLGVVHGFRTRGGYKATPPDPFGALLGGEGRNDPAVQAFFLAAAGQAVDERAPLNARVAAVSLRGYTDFDFASATLAQLLDARQPPGLQLQTVRALERLGDPRGGSLLISKENWGRYTPPVRGAVIATATGWLAGETESSLTLRTAFGTEETILRKSIATMTTSGVSLMPDGREQTFAKEDVSVMVAYLKSGD